MTTGLFLTGWDPFLADTPRPFLLVLRITCGTMTGTRRSWSRIVVGSAYSSPSELAPLAVPQLWQQSFHIYSSNVVRWHRLALTALLPALFCCIFGLLVGDTLCETSAAETDLPYSLEFHHNSSTEYNAEANGDISDNSTIFSNGTNETISLKSLSLAQEWTEHLPWILSCSVLFVFASALVHAVIVVDTAIRFYCASDNDEGDGGLTVQLVGADGTPLSLLRRILWRRRQ